MLLERRIPSRALFGLMAAVLAVVFMLAAGPRPAFASSVRLMVDPGHGGSDPGAEAGGLQEKDSNLRISKMIAESARRQGWSTALTRKDDTFVGLSERPSQAKAWKATVLVSVHSNSTGAAPLGNMTIYRSGSSGRLGDSIMKRLAPLTPYPDIGNRSDVRGLAVLRHAEMPSVIVELLSVTSGVENRALRSPEAQRRMAEAVVRGVAEYQNVKYYAPSQPKTRPKPATASPTPTTPRPSAAPERRPQPKPEPKPKAEPARESKSAKTPKADGSLFDTIWRLLFG